MAGVASQDDVDTALLVLGVGLVVGHVAAQGRKARVSAAASRGEMQRSGTVPLDASSADRPSGADYRFQREGFELPEDGAELEVLGRCHRLGRFVLQPIPNSAVSLEERIVAVAIADQVGAVLAASPEQKGSLCG